MAVLGDPAGMRAAAAQLRLRAGTVRTSVGNLESRVAQMTYAGPAADQMRANIGQSDSNLRGLADRMDGVAERLAREAANVEQLQLIEARELRG